MSTLKQDELRQRTFRAMLEHAFFRWESAVTIATFIVLFFLFPQPLPWWQPWYWLALGGVSESLIVITSLTDERTGQQVVANMLRQRFNPAAIRTPAYREKIEKALQYRARIESFVQGRKPGVLRDHLRDTTAGVTDWIANMYRLAKGMDEYLADTLVQRDLGNLPGEITALRVRAQRENDPAVRAQIEQAIQAKQGQLDNLRKLQDVMERAEYQLETSLSALGMVYSQLQLLGAQDIDSSRSRRLAQDIADQIQALQDIVSSMEQVYQHGTPGPIIVSGEN